MAEPISQQNLKSLLANTVSFVNKQQSRKALIRTGYIVLISTLVLVLSIPLIYLLGSKRVHRHNMNLLYDTFQNSQQHEKLYQIITKKKYALIYGDLDGGLFNFMDHLANKQSLKERNVIVQDFHTTVSVLSEWIEQMKYMFEQTLDLEDKFKNIWILTSKDGQNIPKTAILKIIHRHPKDKIYVAITRKQKLPSFQVFQYPSITEHDVKESIESNFQMDESTADILYDFFGTPEAALSALDIGHYSQQQLLGQNFREWIDFSQEDIRVLRDLCKHGQANVEGISQELIQFGLINYGKQIFWSNRYFMLNYELHKKLRCANDGVVTDQTMFQIQQDLENDEQDKTQEELMQEQVWNEDQIFEVESKPKKGKSKKQKSKK